MANKEVVIGFYKAIGNKDFAKAEKLLGPHVVMPHSDS